MVRAAAVPYSGRDLTNVFRRLYEHGNSLKLSKCLFVKDSHEWLGYVVRTGKISPSKKYIEQISTLVPPKTKKQLRSVLGVLDRLRDFTKNYTEKTLRISEHVKDDVFRGLSPEALDQYKKIKDEMVEYIQKDRANYYPRWDVELRACRILVNHTGEETTLAPVQCAKTLV